MRLKTTLAIAAASAAVASSLAAGAAGANVNSPGQSAPEGGIVSANPAAATVAAAKQKPTRTGFVKPFSGKPKYQYLAPKQITSKRQMNKPLGQARADEIAKGLGLKKSLTFTKKQFRRFVSGKGVGGNKPDAKLVDASVRILTNTVGRPLISNVNGHRRKSVLASYARLLRR